jgi:PKHD-type hydroxylase
MESIYQTRWAPSSIPSDLIEGIVRQCETIKELEKGTIGIQGEEVLDKKIRNSEVAFLPEHHWIACVMRQVVEQMNIENFKYDLDPGFDQKTVQFGIYGPAGHYVWHKDSDIFAAENRSDLKLRKLSVTVQLSEPDDYEGGELQMQGPNGELYECPKERGTVIVFDSRTLHRVRPIKSGVRKSLVGWVTGPRWR